MSNEKLPIDYWSFVTDRPDRFLNRMWRMWVRVRLRHTKKGEDFLSAGFYINAPQVDSRNFFTGIILGLLTRTLHVGYWRPLNHYRLAGSD